MSKSKPFEPVVNEPSWIEPPNDVSLHGETMTFGLPNSNDPPTPVLPEFSDPPAPVKLGASVLYCSHGGNVRAARVIKIHPAGDCDLFVYTQVGDNGIGDSELTDFQHPAYVLATHKPFSHSPTPGHFSLG